jgi:pyruvate formate lyase activating enzyme
LILSVETAGSGIETRRHRRGPALASDEPRFTPEQVVFVARAWNTSGVFLRSDDPVFGASEGHEILAQARAARLKTALTTTGFLLPIPREILLRTADVVNLRIWSVRPSFYFDRFGAAIQPVLSTIEWLSKWRDGTVEITTPLLPGENDGPGEIEELARWIARTLGAAVPIHFEAGDPRVTPKMLSDAAEMAREAPFRSPPPASFVAAQV